MNETTNQPVRLDTRRILIFIVFAFGMAWLTGLVIYLTGGLQDSPVLVPELGLTLAYVLLATAYMGAPALANLLTRLLTREGWKNIWLWPRLKQSWPYWLAGWFIPILATILGAAAFFLLFPQFFDPNITQLSNSLRESGSTTTVNPWTIALINIGVSIIAAPLVNSLFTFGEEFGWRGYLLPKLLPLGSTQAILLSGAIWGVWHWPVIAMGYNYGFDYPGFPWVGMLLMVWFTILTGIFLSWITLRSGSVWPAVIGHAAINGISSLGAIFIQGEPSMLIGPFPLGAIGSLGWLVLAVLLALLPGALEPKEFAAEPEGAG